MNKQYLVDQEGNVKIITNTNQILEYSNANRYIGEILSLENYQEQTNKKINYFDKLVKEFSNKIHKKKKNHRTFNIILSIILTLLLITSALINMIACLIIFLSIIPLSIIIEVIENKLLSKDREENQFYTQRSKEESYRLDKIKSKIEALKKDKNKIKTNNPSKYIDVLPIEKHNLDSEDYFIENYQIEKRTREMTKSTPKKLTRKINTSNTYKI